MPTHHGAVTEAGDGEDGRIKSALGIGALLEDGLGDTIRVSLTKNRNLSAVAISLANRYEDGVRSFTNFLLQIKFILTVIHINEEKHLSL